MQPDQIIKHSQRAQGVQYNSAGVHQTHRTTSQPSEWYESVDVVLRHRTEIITSRYLDLRAGRMAQLIRSNNAVVHRAHGHYLRDNRRVLLATAGTVAEHVPVIAAGCASNAGRMVAAFFTPAWLMLAVNNPPGRVRRLHYIKSRTMRSVWSARQLCQRPSACPDLLPELHQMPSSDGNDRRGMAGTA